MADFYGHDPAASQDFYENVLGLELVMDQGRVRTYAASDNPVAQITMMHRDATPPCEQACGDLLAAIG